MTLEEERALAHRTRLLMARSGDPIVWVIRVRSSGSRVAGRFLHYDPETDRARISVVEHHGAPRIQVYNVTPDALEWPDEQSA